MSTATPVAPTSAAHKALAWDNPDAPDLCWQARHPYYLFQRSHGARAKPKPRPPPKSRPKKAKWNWEMAGQWDPT